MADFSTKTAELVEALREAPADALRNDAADLIERLTDRVNHLTNINDGLRETLDDQRKGLAELREMLATGETA